MATQRPLRSPSDLPAAAGPMARSPAPQTVSAVGSVLLAPSRTRRRHSDNPHQSLSIPGPRQEVHAGARAPHCRGARQAGWCPGSRVVGAGWISSPAISCNACRLPPQRDAPAAGPPGSALQFHPLIGSELMELERDGAADADLHGDGGDRSWKRIDPHCGQGASVASGFRLRGREQRQTVLHHQALVGLAVDPESCPGRHRFRAE